MRDKMGAGVKLTLKNRPFLGLIIGGGGSKAKYLKTRLITELLGGKTKD